MKLHAYAQHSMRHREAPKLQPKWFYPFLVLKCVGVVAYKLDLLSDASIHAHSMCHN